MLMAKYLYWRGCSLWCRYPLPDKPACYPLNIKRLNNTRVEIERCIRLGEIKLAEYRVKSVTGELTAQRKKKYNPTFRRICRRYWCNCLRWQKSGMNELYHLKKSYLFFGNRLAREITRDDINSWMQKQKQDGAAVNTINNRFAYLARVYSWANTEDREERKLDYNPCLTMEKMKGAAVRTFVLTQEQFERNYQLFLTGKKYDPGKKPNPNCMNWNHNPDVLLISIQI